MAPPTATPLPQIEVTDSQGKDVKPAGPSPVNSWPRPNGPHGQSAAADAGHHAATTAAEAKRSPSDAGSHSSISAKASGGVSPGDGDRRREARSTIDPLSQHILKRTQTENTIPQRLRVGTSDISSRDAASGSVAPSLDGTTQVAWDASDKNAPETTTANKDKKRGGVSFLSRIIGNKKKEPAHDSADTESETGERRTEGMDAHVFSHPITSNGFTPHHPAPPKYIKVRTHHKKTPDFNRVFLAQELRRGGNPHVTASSGGGGDGANAAGAHSGANAIWSLEFSVDGRFMAAAGQDRVVHVWAVITTAEEREAHESEEATTTLDAAGQAMRLHAPVFKTYPIREYEGHTSDVLDLSWSKNNFLLSSSMDKTVRLWHVSRAECLCCFKHSDFVTSIAFHPRDDRFFLAGSLDSKLRLWSIPDKSVAYWNQLPDLITAVAFTPDGKTSIAGCLNGHCLFYDTEGLRYSTQIHVRSARGRNAKGSKIAGIQTTHLPPHDLNAEVKLLVTSNDSRIRMYNFRDQSLEMKFRGNENSCSQIRASFSDEARYVICGSEDRKVYIWSTGPAESDKKDRQPVEMFTAHSAIVTATALAPVKTRQMLGRSGDPIYDLCNPPPVTLISRAESRASSRPPTGAEKRLSDANLTSSTTATAAAAAEARAKTVTPAEESPLYITRSAHPDGNIIVSADYMGIIKVFRQDCAYSRRRSESWDAPSSSTFSKKMVGGGILHRNTTSAAAARTGTGTSRRRASTSSHGPSSERILSWRNAISSSNTSLDKVYRTDDRNRSASPRKLAFSSSSRHHAPGSTPLTHTNPPSISTSSPPGSIHQGSIEHSATSQAAAAAAAAASQPPPPPPQSQRRRSVPPHATMIEKVASNNNNNNNSSTDPDPLMLQADGQSLAFWNVSNWQRAGHPYVREEGRPLTTATTATTTTATTNNDNDDDNDDDDDDNREGILGNQALGRQERRNRKMSVVSATSAVSALSSEIEDERERKARVAAAAAVGRGSGGGGGGSGAGDLESEVGDSHAEQVLRCRNCGSGSFQATRLRHGGAGRGRGRGGGGGGGGGGEVQRLVCSK